MKKRQSKPYGLLEDGTIQCLYYRDEKGNIDLTEPRMFYKEGRKWYLMYDIYEPNCIMTIEQRIVKFLTEEEMRALKDETATHN